MTKGSFFIILMAKVGIFVTLMMEIYLPFHRTHNEDYKPLVTVMMTMMMVPWS